MKILLIEDDIDLCKAIAFHLKKEGYEADLCHNGEDAISYILQYNYDLIVLDRMLPLLNGLQVLQQLRKKQVFIPVIMVTAMNHLHDRIDGLDAGADDYLVKPFDMEELLARVRALLRRPRKISTPDCLTYSNLVLEYREHQLKSSTLNTSLSKKEAGLLEYFMRNPNQTLSREQIFARVWGSDPNVEESSLDSYICFLRKRLRAVSSHAVIKTIHGLGYRLEEGEV